MATDSLQKYNRDFAVELAKNLVAGLTVSFVAISLGAAFGILSGRGAFAGILSAGIFALIAGLFGGTRIQASGPTAPMTAVTVLVIAYATSTGQYVQRGLQEVFPGVDTVRFINLVFALTAVLLIITAICRLGRFIQLVPKTVISGFMNGIAILIWVDQTKKLFGLAGESPYKGSIPINVVVALAAFLIAFAVPIVAKRWFPRFKSFLPGTLVVIWISGPESCTRTMTTRMATSVPGRKDLNRGNRRVARTGTVNANRNAARATATLVAINPP